MDRERRVGNSRKNGTAEVEKEGSAKGKEEGRKQKCRDLLD